MNEQLGQPSFQSGPSMKWYTINWLLPPKRSASVSLPFGPSKTYDFATFSHGSSWRCRVSWSRSRENSFSFFNSSLRASTHSDCDTTFGPSLLLVAVAMIHSPLICGLRRFFHPAVRTKHLHGEGE